MVEDTEAARKARAERLHRKIERMKSGQPEEKKSSDTVKPEAAETPSEFVHRKMHEMDKPKK